jgi:hypothetical protein
MWSRRGFMVALGTVALAGCGSQSSNRAGSSHVVYVDSYGSLYDDYWIYYDEDDEDFIAGLTDEQKAALKQKWDSLSPEEKQQIRDRWNSLTPDQRAQVRQGWGSLSTTQREQAITSMQSRARSGTLGPVVPIQPAAERFQSRPAGGFDRAAAASRGFSGRGSGSFGGGGFSGGRGGGRR